jgi:superfamily I DNA and/or RNA helicase
MSIVSKDLPSILLKCNYRTRMELVRFISAVFYGGPEVLHSFCSLPDVYGVIPLTLYTAQGYEIQDSQSTSYYNLAEVEEIVERVSTLVQCWPEEWVEEGLSPCESILVVSPYLDQVMKCFAVISSLDCFMQLILMACSSNLVYCVLTKSAGPDDLFI